MSVEISTVASLKKPVTQKNLSLQIKIKFMSNFWRWWSILFYESGIFIINYYIVLHLEKYLIS